MTPKAETELIVRCRQGDPGAWDELFDLHYQAVARFVFQLDSRLSREDTEEICQETFLAVIRHLNTFSGQSQFQTWAFRIAANKTRDFLDRSMAAKRGGGQRTVSLQAEDPETGLSPDPASANPGPDLLLMAAEQAGLVHQALAELGDPCREIIELKYFGDLSYDEISMALELNAKTVSSRLSKCLDKLEIIARQLIGGKEKATLPSNS